MSKAEDRALEKYPVLETLLGDTNYLPRIGFIEGYHQAEKDLELGWEDIKLIDSLIDDVSLEETDTMEDLYQEVLKRFKDFKERKENGSKGL